MTTAVLDNLELKEHPMMRFEVGNDRGGKPVWWLYAANNKLVA